MCFCFMSINERNDKPGDKLFIEHPETSSNLLDVKNSTEVTMKKVLRKVSNS